MDFVTAIKFCLTKYVEFSGRARRSEYWYFTLFLTVLSVALTLAGLDQIDLFVSVALLLPSIAAGVRRLHDTDRSGWWLLLVLLPVIGWIVLLVWNVRRGTAGPNRFGADPLASATLSADG